MTLVRNAALTVAAVFALAGCKREASNQPDDFAERIAAKQNGAQPQQQNPAVTQQVAAKREAAIKGGAVEADEASTSAVKGPYADLVVPPSVQLDDKAAAPCRAVAMSEFLGEPDSPELRKRITAANTAGGGIRFMPAGSQVTQGEKPTRLNVMFDTTGVARDFRCG